MKSKLHTDYKEQGTIYWVLGIFVEIIKITIKILIIGVLTFVGIIAVIMH